MITPVQCTIWGSRTKQRYEEEKRGEKKRKREAKKKRRRRGGAWQEVTNFFLQPQYELLKEYRAFLDRKAQSDISRFNKVTPPLSPLLSPLSC